MRYNFSLVDRTYKAMKEPSNENKLNILTAINPVKPNSSNYYILPYRPNLPFLISDIRALWRSALSARVPECQKLKTVG